MFFTLLLFDPTTATGGQAALNLGVVFLSARAVRPRLGGALHAGKGIGDGLALLQNGLDAGKIIARRGQVGDGLDRLGQPFAVGLLV